MHRKCHSVFFRNQVIRLDRTSDGKIDVVGGRHRLYACMQLGIDPPVNWAGGDDRGSET
jgi:ParB-like chromosome segregation protein Spo0J